MNDDEEIEVEDEPTYCVIRFFSDNRDRQTIKTGLTRDEAKEHCSDPDSSGTNDDGVKWFDGFEEE